MVRYDGVTKIHNATKARRKLRKDCSIDRFLPLLCLYVNVGRWSLRNEFNKKKPSEELYPISFWRDNFVQVELSVIYVDFCQSFFFSFLLHTPLDRSRFFLLTECLTRSLEPGQSGCPSTMAKVMKGQNRSEEDEIKTDKKKSFAGAEIYMLM